MPRQSTKLESEGAEFLVLGYLLVEGLQAYKMYVNMPGYDVLVGPAFVTRAEFFRSSCRAIAGRTWIDKQAPRAGAAKLAAIPAGASPADIGVQSMS